MLKPRSAAIVGFILFAALFRIVPHPWNISPLGAMALFGGAKFRGRAAALLFPLGALLLSDWTLGFYSGIWAVYLGYAAIVVVGRFIQKRQNVCGIGFGALASSSIFYLITNFGPWLPECHYPKTLQGIIQGYIAGIPFYRNTLVGDLFYSAVLFGGFALLEKWVPAIRTAEEPGATAVA
jgi:hypothetical protein